MLTKKYSTGRTTTFAHWRKREGQAIAEFTISLIALSVLFLGILLFGDLCKARVQTILDSREEAGFYALGGTQIGNPIYDGTIDSGDRIKTDLLKVTEDPIAYQDYAGGAYPGMKNNLTYPFHHDDASLVAHFKFSKIEKTIVVTNSEFLTSMKVGKAQINITQDTTLPVMTDFN